jgi:ankyrin repeat protein
MVELAEDLVARGANLNARLEAIPGSVYEPGRGGGVTPLLSAARGGHVEVMQLLISLGANPQDQTNDGAGAVLFATRSRSFEAVRLLVELGVDVNAGPSSRPSALHTAIRFGEDDIVEYLANNGADFEALDHNGRTPLEEAEFEAPTPTIELMRRLTATRAN